MIEIRFHGRGGQGAVTAAEILAKAVFEEGKYTQAFPSFGVERRGAPVTAFTRISDEPIRRRYQIYEPKYVVVLDETLANVVNLTSGLKDDGAVLINTERTSIPSLEKQNIETHEVDATKIALDTIDSILKIIDQTFPDKIAKSNKEATEYVYNSCVDQK